MPSEPHPRHAAIAQDLGGRLVDQRPLRGGVCAEVVALDLAMPDGALRRVVARTPAVADWVAPDPEAARREHALLGWLHAQGMPVPAPCWLDAEGRFGPPSYAMAFVEGDSRIDDPGQALPRMAEVLARLHALDPAGAPPLRAREDPRPWLLEHLPPGPARDRLQARPPAPPPRRVVLHGDYWPGNLLWRAGSLEGVLDWEDAAVGDPVSDLACARLELRYLFGLEGAETFTGAYAQHADLDRTRLPLWEVYVSAAALHYMSHWGLAPETEAHMRREAEACRDAALALL